MKIRQLPKTTIFCFCLFLSYCTVDELPQPKGCAATAAAYEVNIKQIIEESCAYNGCHDGNSPDAPGDFRTYEGLLPFLRGGTVRARVVDLRSDPIMGMPPSRKAFPQSQKENLTEEEFELMRCWLSSGFPE